MAKVPDVSQFRIVEGPGGTYNKLNDGIPMRCDTSARAVLYNVHGFIPLEEGGKMELEFERDIQRLEPTVLALQDIPAKGDAKRTQMETILDRLGYSHRLEAADPSWLVMLASKLKVANVRFANLSGQWVAGRVALEGYKPVVLINSWLKSAKSGSVNESPPADVTRGRLLIVPLVEEDGKEIHLPATWGATHMSVYPLFDPKAQPPPYTSWTGLALDSIVADLEMRKMICGAYTFHTATTGRLPQVVDFGACKFRARPPNWFFLTAALAAIVFCLGYLYYR